MLNMVCMALAMSAGVEAVKKKPGEAQAVRLAGMKGMLALAAPSSSSQIVVGLGRGA